MIAARTITLKIRLISLVFIFSFAEEFRLDGQGFYLWLSENRNVPSLTVGLPTSCAPPIVRKPPECRARAVAAQTHECLSIPKSVGTLRRVSKMMVDKAKAQPDCAESN